MRYKVLIERDSSERAYKWEIWLKDFLLRDFKPNATGFERRLSRARSRVAVALQQLKAEHEEDLRNAGKRIEFEGEL